MLASVVQIFDVSPSETMSLKWYSNAAASVGWLETRSQRSMVREVKPVVER